MTKNPDLIKMSGKPCPSGQARIAWLPKVALHLHLEHEAFNSIKYHQMQRLEAFKFELRPNGQQRQDMHRFAGACRFVFNKALALQKENYASGGKFISYVDMAKRLTAWRQGAETPWLAQAPVHPLQQSLKDLEKAYKNFFSKRSSFPRFKRKNSQSSFRFPDPKQFKLDASNTRIFLPKLGWTRLRLSRPVLGELKNATLSYCAGNGAPASVKQEPTEVTTQEATHG